MVIGIICEYNPFHNGHLYHLKKIKEKYPNSLIILCLNGYFLERGEVSILKKADKVKIALLNGVDIVVELPVLYGTQAADKFAMAGISLLDALNVDKIIFGSETNNLDYLMDIAKKQDNLNLSKMKNNLKKGNSYPKSLINSLNELKIKPNDLLGISYCKAILKQNLKIELETILRTNDFHDKISNEEIISAENIREKIKNNNDISKYVPSISKDKIIKVNYNLYFKLLKHKILTDSHLDLYLDVNEGIENLLKKAIVNANNYEEFLIKIKSKRYTTNRLQRMLLHINLGILKKDAELKIDYLKILGFNDKGAYYLNQNKKKFKLPIKVKKNSLINEYELKASILYDLITNEKEYDYEKLNKPLYIKTAPNLKESNQK